MDLQKKKFLLSELSCQIFRCRHEDKSAISNIDVDVREDFSLEAIEIYAKAFMFKRGFKSSQIEVYTQTFREQLIVFSINLSLIKEEDIERMIKAIRSCLNTMAVAPNTYKEQMVV